LPTAGRCAILGLVFSWPENHKMHIAHLDRFGSVGRCAILGCISWPENHKMHIAHLIDSVRLVDVPRFKDAHTGTKRRLDVQMNNRGTGISGLCAIRGFVPCGKKHFREIATPDWVGTLRRFIHTRQYVLFVKLPTQSGVAISRKCFFPHGFCISSSSSSGRRLMRMISRYLHVSTMQGRPRRMTRTCSWVIVEHEVQPSRGR